MPCSEGCILIFSMIRVWYLLLRRICSMLRENIQNRMVRTDTYSFWREISVFDRFWLRKSVNFSLRTTSKKSFVREEKSSSVYFFCEVMIIWTWSGKYFLFSLNISLNHLLILFRRTDSLPSLLLTKKATLNFFSSGFGKSIILIDPQSKRFPLFRVSAISFLFFRMRFFGKEFSFTGFSRFTFWFHRLQ